MELYKYFYSIAEYANANWGGAKIPRELALMAYEWTESFKHDMKHMLDEEGFGKEIRSLIENLERDETEGNKEAWKLLSEFWSWVESYGE